MNPSDALSNLCDSFNKYQVEYLVVGGLAVAYHGYPRATRNERGEVADKLDIDIWYNPTYKNYFSLIDALCATGFNTTYLKDEQAPDPKKSYLKLNTDSYTLDCLPQLALPISFRDAFNRKNSIDLNSVNISIIGYEDLLYQKLQSTREKDKIDADELIKRNTH